jgi:hypothetical protein
LRKKNYCLYFVCFQPLTFGIAEPVVFEKKKNIIY